MLPTNDQMNTLSTIIEKLRMRRQDNEFIMTAEGFKAVNGKAYDAKDLSIIKTYRFEGDSNPSDSSILYLIEATDGLVGYSIDAYGAFSNHGDGYDDFIRSLNVEDRDEQLIFGQQPTQPRRIHYHGYMGF